MKVCVRCKDKFSNEEISEWKTEHESFSMNPFLCPDCFDRFKHLDLEDQFDELMRDSKWHV